MNQEIQKQEITKQEFINKYRPQFKVRGVFTTRFLSQQTQDGIYVIKKRKLRGEYQKTFLDDIKNEIQTQYRFSEKYPGRAIGIVDFTTFTSKRDDQVIMIAYSNDPDCLPILEYIKYPNIQLRKKIEISLTLFQILQNLQQFGVPHNNIKPNNILYDQTDVMLTDFGSNRTFYQNYIQQYTRQDQQKWQSEYYFYNPKQILEIIRDNEDQDLRNGELKQLRHKFSQNTIQKSQNLENILNNSSDAFILDKWAIGIIIIRLFFIDETINQNIDQYYSMNNTQLQNKIEQIKLLDENIGVKLQELLNPYNQPQQPRNQQIQQNQQIQVNIRVSQIINLGNPILINQQAQPQDNLNNKLLFNKNVLKLNLDKFQLQLQEGYQHPALSQFLNSRDQDEKMKRILGIHQIIQLSTSEINNYIQVINQIKRTYEDQKYLNNQRIQERQRNQINQVYPIEIGEQENQIEKYINKQLECINENIFLCEIRLLALQYYYNNKIETPEENIIYYYNISELTLIQYMNQFQIIDEQNDGEKLLKRRHFQQTRIAELIKLRKKEFKLEFKQNVNLSLEEQKTTSIYFLKKYQKPEQEIFEAKEAQINQFGAEQFHFNVQLKARNKVKEFIQKKRKEYFLNYSEYNSISPKVQKEYLKEYYKFLDTKLKQQESQDEINLYIEGINSIFPKLVVKYKEKYIYLQFNRLEIKNIDEIVDQFFQRIYSYQMKVDYKYYGYLKNFEILEKTQDYNGYLINKKPHGYGIRRVNKNNIIFGIFQYGKILWGWEIQKIQNEIQLYKGQFLNEKKHGKGSLKKFTIINNHNYYFFVQTQDQQNNKIKQKGEFQNNIYVPLNSNNQIG